MPGSSYIGVPLIHPKFQNSILSPKDFFLISKGSISVKIKFLSSLELNNFLINFFLSLFLCACRE